MTVDEIKEVAAMEFDIEPAAIMERTRIGPVVGARQMAHYLARKLTKLSYTALGKKFKRSRRTLIYSYRRIERLRAAEIELDRHIERLESSLLGAAK